MWCNALRMACAENTTPPGAPGGPPIAGRRDGSCRYCYKCVCVCVCALQAPAGTSKNSQASMTTSSPRGVAKSQGVGTKEAGAQRRPQPAAAARPPPATRLQLLRTLQAAAGGQRPPPPAAARAPGRARAAHSAPGGLAGCRAVSPRHSPRGGYISTARRAGPGRLASSAAEPRAKAMMGFSPCRCRSPGAVGSGASAWCC
jgi:hypothetical protein